MTSPKNPHGGPGRGQGRKPVSDGQPTVTVSLRMTAAQRDKLSHLGGAKWVRAKIDDATKQQTAPWPDKTRST